MKILIYLWLISSISLFLFASFTLGYWLAEKKYNIIIKKYLNEINKLVNEIEKIKWTKTTLKN